MSFPAQAVIRSWRETPPQFVKDCFGVDPDPWQLEVLKAFPHNQRQAMKACKGPGKTTVLAWLCWNFLATRPHPKIAATSITGDNLRDGLWAEMAKWQGRSEFLRQAFKWTATRIFLKESPADWWMSSRTWVKGADPQKQADTLAGLHADYIMFVLDEAGGIPDAVMAAAEAALANDMGDGTEAHIVMAGNPTHLEGPLYRACTSEAHLWWTIAINSDPDDPNRTPRVSKKWAQDQIEKYGRDNPWVLVNVFGKFPPSSINTLLGPEEVDAAMKRHLRSSDYEWAQKRLGIDVARFGDDRTIIFPRQGLVSFHPVTLRNADTVKIAARAAMAINRWGSEREFVDDTGHWGHGVIDNLRAGGYGPVGIQYHAPAINPRYYNRRAEMWLEMAEWVKRGGALPNIPELKGELTTPTYTFVNGKILLEPKDKVKERLGRSPDLADGLGLTFAEPDVPADFNHLMPALQPKSGNIQSDWNPFGGADE